MTKETIKNLVYLLTFFKVVAPILGCIYIFCWCVQFLNEDLFKSVNKIFGLFPSIIDSIIPSEVDLRGTDGTMGYIYGAIVLVLFTYLCNKMTNGLDKVEKNIDIKNVENEKRVKEERIKAIQRQRYFDVMKRSTFFGLIDMKFNYYDEYKNKPEDINKIKIEYSKMISKKLQEKYSDVRFATNNKIYLVSNNFDIFDNVVLDFVTLYKAIKELNEQKGFKTTLNASFWAGEKTEPPQDIIKILSKVNSLGYENKIIVSGWFYYRYQELPKRKFAFDVLGMSKLIAAMPDNSDLDLNLYALKNPS